MEENRPQLSLAPESLFRREHRLVPLIVVALVVLTILLSATKIVSYGYLPPDDALRHAAKAVSGKSWDQILVMRPDFPVDHNYGWHKILTGLHHSFGWGTDGLVAFSVSSLLIVFCLSPLPGLRRPEAWLAAMVVFSLYSGFLRMALGRPFILTAGILLAILMLWREERSKVGPSQLAVTTLMISAAVFIHGSWYLFALPVAAYVIVGRLRAALQITACWLSGTLVGACLTGHPVEFIIQAIRIATASFGNHALQRMLVPEFQPSDGAFPVVLVIGFVLVFRKSFGFDVSTAVRNPIFVLAALGWVLGLAVVRFWDDWGAPAACLWLALEIQNFLELSQAKESLVRLGTAAALAFCLYTSVTRDHMGRWTNNLTQEYLNAEDPDLAEWLPGKRGTLYCADMYTFYQTFYRNPKAEWRYILGFEPTFMPLEDLKVFRNIQWNHGLSKAYLPWVEKMGPEDRLVIRRDASGKPGIKELDWKYAVPGLWIGRVPRTGTSETSSSATKS